MIQQVFLEAPMRSQFLKDECNKLVLLWCQDFATKLLVVAGGVFLTCHCGGIGLYTTVNCDNVTHRLPVTVSHQQRAPAFDIDETCWVVCTNNMP